MIPAIIDIPPGLAIIISFFLFMSLTVKFRLCKNFISGGVLRYTVKKATTHETIAGIINSVNI
jgi:Na+/H+ antiporter NhaA